MPEKLEIRTSYTDCQAQSISVHLFFFSHRVLEVHRGVMGCQAKKGSVDIQE